MHQNFSLIISNIASFELQKEKKNKAISDVKIGNLSFSHSFCFRFRLSFKVFHIHDTIYAVREIQYSVIS